MSDLDICAWVLVVIAQSHRAWARSYAGQVSAWAGKISGYYVDESYHRELDLWAEKGLEAARQEAHEQHRPGAGQVLRADFER